MKKNLILLLLCLSSSLFAQNSDKVNHSKSYKDNDKIDGKIFLNFAEGINNPFSIFGFGVDFGVKPNIMVGVGIGQSTWGNKTNGKIMYFLNGNYHGGAVGGSLNFSTGMNYSNTKNTNSTTNITDYIDVKGTSIVSLNLMYANYRNVGKRSKFYLQTGYAVRFNNPEISMKYTGTQINYVDNTLKTGYEYLKPGGIIANIGFLVCIDKKR